MNAHPSPILSSPAGRGLRYALSIGLLAWIASQVDWGSFRALDAVDWALAAPAVLLAGLAFPLQAWRWQILLAAHRLVLPRARVHRLFWISQFFNSFLPGGIAGDALRFLRVANDHPGRRSEVAAGLVADRLLGLGALLALGLVALALHFAVAGETAGLEALLGGSLAAFALLLGFAWSVARTRWWQPLAARLVGADAAQALQDAALALGREHRALATAGALSVAVWLLDFAALGLLAHAVGMSAGPLPIVVAATAAYVAAALPISVGGHGVREGALVATLALLGHGGAPALALAAAMWAVTVGWSLPGGLLWLLPSGRSPRA